MEIFDSIITAVLCLLCFACCKGWAISVDIAAANEDKLLIKLAQVLGRAGDVFHYACWISIAVGFCRAFGLF
ncbi:hypothetical protein S8c_00040 [Klebsiella phage VLCpiS8c]|nr:hypothetical protein S8c_00040 [Klebsiella phage VLCpiS8c]